MAFVLSVVTIAIAVASVHVSAWWFSPGVMILPILAGGLLLWPRALRIFFGFAAVALIYDVARGQGRGRDRRHHRAHRGLRRRARADQGEARRPGPARRPDAARAAGPHPGPGQAARARRGLGVVPGAQPAGGSSFGGDFVVSFCDGKTLEVALVDVSGKGIDAGTRALLLSGAFGGLLGSVPRDEFLPACNAYLRRGSTSEGFVTAVHLSLDLATGEYVVGLGRATRRPCTTTGRRAAGGSPRPAGIVLGVVPDLHGAAAETEHGVLQRGDALMLYTDGLVEAPGRDIDVGHRPAARRGRTHAGQRLPRRRARSGRGHATGDRRLRRLRPGPALAHLSAEPTWHPRASGAVSRHETRIQRVLTP